MNLFSCCLKFNGDDKYKVLEDPDCACNDKTITRLVGDNLHECVNCRKLYRCVYTYYCNYCTSKQPISFYAVPACYFCGFNSLTLSKQFIDANMEGISRPS